MFGFKFCFDLFNVIWILEYILLTSLDMESAEELMNFN